MSITGEFRRAPSLGVDAGALTAHRNEGRVLGLTTSDGVPVYPVAQFHRHNGTTEVKPALLPLLQALRSFEPWTIAVLLHTPAPELDNRTPFDWVRQGGSPNALADVAHAVVREWTAGQP